MNYKNEKISRVESEPNIIYELGDATDTLSKYADISFDLIMTSPPYNLGKEYEQTKSIEAYLADQEDVIDKLVKLMSDRGSICWQVGNWVEPKTKEIFPLDIYYYQMFKKRGLVLRNRIIWHFGHGFHASNRFSGRYETILWFTRPTTEYIFNLDPVRVPSKYPGKRHYKGAKKGKLSGNPKGKNPSDIWEIVIKDWEKEIWDIPNVKANHREKTEHPCQYPIELIERCVLALTNEGSWILDPFAGVGSTLLGAYMHNRNAVGIELHQKYIDIGQQRLGALKEGTLKYRELTKPIYDHKKSKLSIIPEDFKNHANNQ
ncbi:MAG: site-specific DNA-methyltransferase [Ardenticatenaceae bacterium]|nr:site-specific DNA-methyltransferase [Ardenticatenaceae bacterium]